MVDVFYAEAGHPDGFRKESFRIAASDDTEAVREATQATNWRKHVHHFHVRTVSRQAEHVIYRSEDA